MAWRIISFFHSPLDVHSWSTVSDLLSGVLERFTVFKKSFNKKMFQQTYFSLPDIWKQVKGDCRPIFRKSMTLLGNF